jgi:hypothetical protein
MVRTNGVIDSTQPADGHKRKLARWFNTMPPALAVLHFGEFNDEPSLDPIKVSITN